MSLKQLPDQSLHIRVSEESIERRGEELKRVRIQLRQTRMFKAQKKQPQLPWTPGADGQPIQEEGEETEARKELTVSPKSGSIWLLVS